MRQNGGGERNEPCNAEGEVPRMPELVIGKVTHFFGKISVAIVELTGPLKVGQTLHFKGAHTDFTQVVESMQIEHVNVEEANAGDAIGIKVADKVREGDEALLET